MPNRIKVLIVEDEPDLRELLAYHLNREGFNTLSTGDGYTALKLVRAEQPDLLLLDLMIEGLEGLKVCQQLKESSHGAGLSIIIVSGLVNESDITLGLEKGADDYIRKPFKPKEVIARVRTVLRRMRAPRRAASEQVLTCPPLSLDPASHEVRLHDELLSLTASEYRLLRFFLSHPGRVFTRAQLLAQLNDHKPDVIGRNIDVHIRSLRLKLGAHAALIDTVRGIGYRFLTPKSPGELN